MSNYNYGPPPPPPSQAGHQPYAHSYAPATPARGGGSHARGGRGGGHMGGYNAGRPEYQPPSQSPYPYSGYSPQTPASYASDGSYQTPPQWQPEHAPPPSHAPAPLSSANYHPNYAQPSYGQPQPQYSGHPSYAPPSQPAYPPQYAAAPPASSPQWSAPASHPAQGNAYGGGGRHRGGYQGDRGGSRGPPAVRMPYREEHPPPPNPAFSPAPYQDPRAPATPYQPQPAPQAYHYAPPPPPPPVAAVTSTLPQRHGSHFSHVHGGNNRRGGRGGSFRDGNRGRSQFHSAGDKQRHHKKPNNARNEPNYQKQEQQGQGKKKKRKVNTLGLIPGDASGSEEDDEGEEGKLSDLMGSEVIQITNMAAFIAERRKRYPTKDRVEAKQAAELAQQAQETERTSRLEREANKLRRQLEKVESSIKRKREQQDEGDDMRQSSPEADSDADMPEVQSSRAPDEAAEAAAAQAAARKADITRHCKYYSTGGSCGKKGKCRFVHDPAVREAAVREKEANNGQLTIKQRLILNDKEQEDLSVLESIQYLRDKGLMRGNSGLTSKPGGGPGRPQGRASKPPTPLSTLPAPPPSLPLPPNKRENGASQPAASKPAPAPVPAATSSPASTPASTASASEAYGGWNPPGYSGAGIQPEDLP